MATLDKSVSLAEVEESAREAHTASMNMFGTSVNYCTHINNNIKTAIEQDCGIPAPVVHGAVTGENGGRVAHAFIRIPAGHVEGVQGPLIIDGALDQFTDEYYPEIVDARVGAKSDFRDGLVIVSPSQNNGNSTKNWYRYYSE